MWIRTVFLFFALTLPALASDPELTINPSSPQVGDTLTLSVSAPGKIGHRTGLFFAPTFASGLLQNPMMFAMGSTDGQGDFSWSTSIPAGMEGTTIYIQAYGKKAGESLWTTNVVPVTVGSGSAAPQAVIETPGNTMKIAPYTEMFSGLASTSSEEIVSYRWDFGDDASADSQFDTGMLAAHRFDQPGTYNVTLTVVNAAGGTDSTSTTITVVPFTGTTYYVSNSTGNDVNDGSSPEKAWKNVEVALSRMGGSQGNPNRLMLKRGDVWTISSSDTISLPGPSILDAYGEGDRPRLDLLNPNKPGQYGSGIRFPWAKEWGLSAIVNNLHIRYPGGPLVAGFIVEFRTDGAVLRGCKVENGGMVGLYQSDGFEHVVVEDSEISGSNYSGWVQGQDWTVNRRNRFIGHGASDVYDHQVYFSYCDKVLMDDCLFDGNYQGNLANKQTAVVNSLTRNCVATRTRNGLDAYTNTDDAITNDNIVFDSNTVYANGYNNQGSGISVGRSKNVKIINNVFHDNDQNPTWGLGALWFTDQLPGATLRVYNNTFYSNGYPDILFSGTTGYTIELKNNIFYRSAGVDNTYDGFFAAKAGSLSVLQSDHNLFFWEGRSASDATISMDNELPNLSFQNWQSIYGQDQNSIFADPLFRNAALLDLRLQPGSPAIDSALPVPAVALDKNGMPRPVGQGPDLGAYEQ